MRILVMGGLRSIQPTTREIYNQQLFQLKTTSNKEETYFTISEPLAFEDHNPEDKALSM